MKKETLVNEETKDVLKKVAKKTVEKIEQDLEVIEKEKTVEAIAEKLKKEHKEVFITDIAGLQIV